jgi:hypothetical protein
MLENRHENYELSSLLFGGRWNEAEKENFTRC